MLKIDISILKTLPSLDKTVIMQIEPLALLSMVRITLVHIIKQ